MASAIARIKMALIHGQNFQLVPKTCREYLSIIPDTQLACSPEKGAIRLIYSKLEVAKLALVSMGFAQHI
jgi:hypothetical protein